MASADDISLRLAFLGFGDEDRRALADLQPLLEKHADHFVDAFYRHLLSFDSTRALLADPEVKERLLQSQREYLLSLGTGIVDTSYVEERIRIGETHERVRLEPRWYLGAYALYGSLLIPLISESHPSDPARAERTVLALLKLLILDAQLAMEAYIRKREEQLEYLTQELAAQSRELERSYVAQGVELRATTERARAAEQLASIGTLVAGLAHEIGTPMGVIQGHAEMLDSSVTDERGQWRLRTIRDQIERISGIIQTLLNMARPHEPQRAEVELRELIEDSLGFLDEKIRRRGIKVELELDGARLDGDSEKLQQVFLNLFLNAADAMPEGGTLRVALGSNGSDEIEIRVSDTGPGMSADVLKRVFEPFFSTKPAGQGSGLGLMVAQGIVQDHGGSISARSTEGKGTEFTIVLPARAS